MGNRQWCFLVFLALLACSQHAQFEPITDATTGWNQAKKSKADLYASENFQLGQKKLFEAKKAYRNFDYISASYRARESEALFNLAIFKTKKHLTDEQIKQAQRELEFIQVTVKELDQKYFIPKMNEISQRSKGFEMKGN